MLDLMTRDRIEGEDCRACSRPHTPAAPLKVVSVKARTCPMSPTRSTSSYSAPKGLSGCSPYIFTISGTDLDNSQAPTGRYRLRFFRVGALGRAERLASRDIATMCAAAASRVSVGPMELSKLCKAHCARTILGDSPIRSQARNYLRKDPMHTRGEDVITKIIS